MENNEKLEKEQPKKKKRRLTGLKDFIKSNLNAFAITMLIVVNVLLSVFSLADGEMNVRNMPTTPLGWILWIISTLLPSVISIMVLQMFRQSGISAAHDKEKYPHLIEARAEYLKWTAKGENEKRAIGVKEYYKKGLRKDSSVKLPIALLTSFLVVSLAVTLNWSAVLGVVINTGIALAFGFNIKKQAIEYATNELYIWYEQEVTRIKKDLGVMDEVVPPSLINEPTPPQEEPAAVIEEEPEQPQEAPQEPLEPVSEPQQLESVEEPAKQQPEQEQPAEETMPPVVEKLTVEQQTAQEPIDISKPLIDIMANRTFTEEELRQIEEEKKML